MDSQKVAALVGTLRGSPSTVLLALLFTGGRPLTVKNLVGLTSYARQTVQRGLERLKTLNLVEESDGHPSQWMLRSHVHQMVLGEDGANVKSFNISGSSSSSSRFNRKVSEVSEEPLPLPSANVKTFNISEEGERAVEIMISLGCAPRRARQAVVVAMKGGWTAGKVWSQARDYRRYCESERGVGLKAPGFYVASRIEQQVEAPYVPESEAEGRCKYIEGRYAEFIQH